MDRSTVTARSFVSAVAVAAVFLLVGCGGDDAVEAPTAEPGTVEVIDAAQAGALLDSDRSVLIVDVRTVGEYRSGHVVGAQNIDVSDDGLWQRRTSALDPEQATVVYCQTGQRSAEAAQRLVALGFTEVYDLGGIHDWGDGDLPVDES